jgi:hypothetical protein
MDTNLKKKIKKSELPLTNRDGKQTMVSVLFSPKHRLGILRNLVLVIEKVQYLVFIKP